MDSIKPSQLIVMKILECKVLALYTVTQSISHVHGEELRCCKEKYIYDFFFLNEIGCEDFSDVFNLCRREGMWGKGARRMENNTKKSYREAVVDILGAGLGHTGICQIHLIKNNGLERKNPSELLSPMYK